MCFATVIAIAEKCWDSSGVKAHKVNSSSSQKINPMDSGSGIRSENEVGIQPSVQRSQLRIQDEPRAPRRSGNYGIQESLECSNVSQLGQVNRGYEPYEPIRVSTPKDCGMLPTQVKREMGVSPRDQSVDKLFIRGGDNFVYII